MQKIKRIAKKIGAISTGAAFLGASLVGAMAADLSEYPNPFVVSGAQNNAVIIHSSNGLDSAAAGYVLTGLSGAITATTGGTVTSVEGGYKLEYSGDKFNLNDTAYDIDQTLSKTKLKTLLKKGTLNDDQGTNENEVEYTQELKFTNRGSNEGEKSIWYIYDQNKDHPEDLMGDYIYLSKSSLAYAWTYEFNLDSALTVADADDLESNKFEILGKQYTVSNVGFTTGNVSKLTLLSGDVTQVVATGDTVNGVTLVSVDANGASCTVEYQGTPYTINDGSTKTMSDGIIIGVTKVTPSNKQASPDYCELNIGADKVELENSKEAKVNGDKVTGSSVTFLGTNFDTFNISYKPNDKIYLSPGDEFEDPVFGAFKLIFGGIVEDDMEDLIFEGEGDNLKITATNEDEDTTTWTAFFANRTGANNIIPGSDDDEPFITQNSDFVSNNTLGVGGVDGLDSMTGIRFLYSKNKKSHIMRITNINTSDNQTTFYDETTDTYYEDQEFTEGGAGQEFSFLSPSFTLNFSRDNHFTDKGSAYTAVVAHAKTIDFVSINDKGPSFFTKNGGNLTFYASWKNSTYDAQAGDFMPVESTGTHTDYALRFLETDTGVETGIPLNTINLNLSYDATNSEINLAAVAASSNLVHRTTALKQKSDEDTTLKAGKTVYGTYLEQVTPTSAGDDSVKLMYPDEATYAEVWISPVGASVTTSTEASTGVDLMAEGEVTDVSMYNAIVVGGPAANEIAANLLGLKYPASGEASGLSEGEAILKLVDNGANVALLAFGWEQGDTQRAAKVLQSYDAYTLSGSEATVSGTTANPDVVTE